MTRPPKGTTIDGNARTPLQRGSSARILVIRKDYVLLNHYESRGDADFEQKEFLERKDFSER